MATRLIKPPRAIRMLTKFGEDALKNRQVNGRVWGPMISRRKRADLRKRAIIDGTFGKFVPNVGGWDPAWDEPRKMFMLRPYKGHKNERTREERAKKNDAAMSTMAERIKKYKEEYIGERHKKREKELKNKAEGKGNDDTIAAKRMAIKKDTTKKGAKGNAKDAKGGKNSKGGKNKK